MKVSVITRALLVILAFYSCSAFAEEPAAREPQDRPLLIDKVFFAQHHVQEPSDPYFKLVGNLESLIKVHVYSDEPRQSPEVVVVLGLGRKTEEFSLTGPKELPKPYAGEPALMPHSYDDSFTGIIPREWVQPGLKVTIELREYNYPHKYNPPGYKGITVYDRKVLSEIRVGAGSKVLLTSFDIHFFEEEKDVDFPEGWEISVAEKLPVAELQVERVKGIIFPEVVMPDGVRCSSMKDYEDRTGKPFDGESAAARVWMRALKRAAGRNYDHGVVFLNLAFVPANGWGERGSLAGTTDLGRMGNFIHEFGHVFSLPHWMGVKAYPYTGHMHGIRTQSDTFPHVGPKWAYSLHRRAFVPPTVQAEGSVGGAVGTWKKDPMQGGGHGDQEQDCMMRHFSDYSVYQMQNFIERRLLYWNEEERAYYRWSLETLSYSVRMKSDGWNLAENPFEDVISVMVSASAVIPEANYVYPPIGPYKAGLLKRFDASSEEDREHAKTFGFSDETCDVCVRVIQGNKAATYLLEMKLDPAADPVRGGAYMTSAINLPATDGAVSMVELMHTPDVVSKGLPATPKVLYSWKAQ